MISFTNIFFFIYKKPSTNHVSYTKYKETMYLIFVIRIIAAINFNLSKIPTNETILILFFLKSNKTLVFSS